MCDYSLCGIPSRLAVEGEELVVHRFKTGSKGLASPADFPPDPPTKEGFWQWLWQGIRAGNLGSPIPNPKPIRAVCIPPGAQLILFHLEGSVFTEYPVTFIQLSAMPYTHRDAIRFEGGYSTLLQYLTPGMRLRVVSLTPKEEFVERELSKRFDVHANLDDMVDVGPARR